MTYKIYRLYDSCECETCGTDYAEGYTIEKDGKIVVDKTPVAHCYDGRSYYNDNPYKDILELEGIKCEEINGEEDE